MLRIVSLMGSKEGFRSCQTTEALCYLFTLYCLCQHHGNKISYIFVTCRPTAVLKSISRYSILQLCLGWPLFPPFYVVWYKSGDGVRAQEQAGGAVRWLWCTGEIRAVPTCGARPAITCKAVVPCIPSRDEWLPAVPGRRQLQTLLGRRQQCLCTLWAANQAVFVSVLFSGLKAS